MHIQNLSVYLHCCYSNGMTNLELNIKKSTLKTEKSSDLPFQEYIMSVHSYRARRRLIADLKKAMDVGSDQQIYRFRYGHQQPSDKQKCEAAKVIRRHSGDGSYTADNLFPAEFYE